MQTVENDFYGDVSGGSFGGLNNTLPPQAIPDSKKDEDWGKSCMNTLSSIARRQARRNINFRDYYKMCDGEFTYSGTSFGEYQNDSFFQQEVKKIADRHSIPTYIRHYDFIGMIVNVLQGMYAEFQDVFRVTSYDEHSTNEYIRDKTALILDYGTQKFKEELDKMLLRMGVDPNKSEFQSEEEQQQFQQEIEQQKKALTPDEIDNFMKKNFKVIATEWAENCLKVDRERMHLDDMEQEQFKDVLLTGRFFTHFRLGIDSYELERWNVEETFFSEDSDAKYPQNGEYVGRQRRISPSKIIDLYGHLLTGEQQESISNYFNQNEASWKSKSGSGIGNSTEGMVKGAFGTQHIVPFQNYYEHDLLKKFENTLGEPLGVRTMMGKDGQERSYDSWMPDFGNSGGYSNNALSKYMRDDIEVRSDTVEVTEGYWRSYKRIRVLTYRNTMGMLSQVLVTDDLMKDYLKENGIKLLKKVTLEELVQAKDEDRLDKYENTIVEQYTPQVWGGVIIKANGQHLKDDIYLNVKPLPFQIKGMSNRYDAPLPVCGLLSNGIAKKLAPYQILGNIVMNQGTDMLEREVGTFLAMDVNYLPSEFKEDGDMRDAIENVMDLARSTGLLAMDMSKQNTAGNQPVNSMQKISLTYGAEIMQKVQLYQTYKQMGFEQIGITAQMMGAPTAYTTAEGVKQGQQAVYAQVTPLFDKMNAAKVQVMNMHLAIAQWSKANGKDRTFLSAGSDEEHYFIDILKEDPELFIHRRLEIGVTTNGKDRKIIEEMKNFIKSDNTVTRNLHDVFSVLTNPTILSMKQIALDNKKQVMAESQQQRQHEQDLADKQVKAGENAITLEWNRKKEIEDNKNETILEKTRIDSTGRVNQKEFNQEGTQAVIDATQDAISNSFVQGGLQVKQQSVDNKKALDDHKMKADLIKLGNESEALKLKREQIESNKYIATINKN